MNNSINKTHRLTGVDLLKGIAAYGVVFIHSTNGEFGSPSYWTAQLGNLFLGFVVPFFLATSFYFLIQKICFSDRPYSFTSRLKFIIIPYLSWSLIYLSVRLLKYLFTGKFIKISERLVDPISIFFLGGTAVQLYFLPLLITGIIATQIIIRILSNKNLFNIKIILILIVLSTAIYELVVVSGNSFHLGPNVAFENLISPSLNKNPLIRLILVYISWLLRCLPYIFIAIVLNNPLFKKEYLKNGKQMQTLLLLLLLLFVLSSSMIGILIPISLKELSAAYLSLLFGISLSNQLQENYIIKSIGVCSFGIYLIHHLIIEFIRPIINKIYPISVDTVPVLICATFSFLLSWLIVFYLRKFQKPKKLLFGG